MNIKNVSRTMRNLVVTLGTASAIFFATHHADAAELEKVAEPVNVLAEQAVMVEDVATTTVAEAPQVVAQTLEATKEVAQPVAESAQVVQTTQAEAVQVTETTQVESNIPDPIIPPTVEKAYEQAKQTEIEQPTQPAPSQPTQVVTTEKKNALLGLDLGLPVLGTVHLGVLEDRESNDANRQYKRKDVVNLQIKDSILAKNTDVSVIGSQSEKTATTSKERAGVVGVDLQESLIGDAHVGVLEKSKTETPEYKFEQSGIALVDLKNTPIGDAHAGVGEKSILEKDGIVVEHSGLVILDTKDTPILGDVHAGVLEDLKVTKTDTNKPGDDTNKPGDDTNVPGNNNDDCVCDDNNGTVTPADDSVKPVVAKPDTKPQVTEASVVPTVEKATESATELPKTGSFMNQTVLVVLALALLAVGFALRRKVRFDM